MQVAGKISATLKQGADKALPASIVGPVRAELSAASGEDGQVRLSDTRLVAGALRADLSGRVDPKTAAYTLDVDAGTTVLQSGHAVLDRLLSGDVTLRGSVAHDGSGPVRLAGMRLDSGNLDMTLDGALGDNLSLKASAQVADLAAVDVRLAGSATMDADIAGAREAPRVKLVARSQSVSLAGAELSEPALRADVLMSAERPAGTINLTGSLRGLPLNAAAEIATDARRDAADRQPAGDIRFGAA